MLHERVRGPCPVCGEKCVGVPDIPYPSTYPFLPGGYDPRSPDMPDDITVTERIFDPDGNLVAAPGDRISADDARRWGVGPSGTMQPGVVSAAPNGEGEPEPEPEPEKPRARLSGRARR